MSAGWFDPILGSWFDETDQEAGWFSAESVDDLSGGGGGIDAVLVGSRGVAGGSSSNSTTAGTTTTGSTFAVCVLYTASGSISSITDSESNSYTLGKSQENSTADITAAIYYCENGTGGASHSATVNFSGSVDSTVWLIEITGAATASFDQVAGAQDDSDPYQITSPTLSQAAECVLTLFGADRGSTGTISTSDSTLVDSEPAGTSGWAGGVSKVITSSTSAVTVSFSDSHGTHDNALALVTFKQAAGGGGAIEEPVGLATESDTASALAAKKIRATGLATETETASSLARVKRRAAGLATTTETASALPRVKSRPVGLATEANTAYALARGGHTIATGLATETDAASALGRLKSRAVGLASETAAAFSLGRIKSRPVGLAIETDLALALDGGGVVPASPGADWIIRHRRRGRR